VNVGDSIPELKTTPDRFLTVRYAGASGDFNPFHYDSDFARSRGFRGVFAHGLFIAGVLGQTLVAWSGPTMLRRLKVRFVDQVWLGDVLTFRAVVVKLYGPQGNEQADLDCTVVSGDSRDVLRGSATLGKPSVPK